MARVREYYRPERMNEALELLAKHGPTSVPLAGGTSLVPRLTRAENEIEVVVGLARLGLDFIKLEGDLLRLGAMATLTDIVESDACRNMAGGLLARAARLNADLNMRNAATVGGLIVQGGPTSELLLALVVLGAEVVVQNAAGSHPLPLSAFLRAPADALAAGSETSQGLLTEIRFFAQDGAGAGLARLSRTPKDRPIIAAAALVERKGNTAVRVSLAMSGVAGMPVRLSGVKEALEGKPLTDAVLQEILDGLGERLYPPDDFRGSAEYRREMAPILARRALEEAWNAGG